MGASVPAGTASVVVVMLAGVPGRVPEEAEGVVVSDGVEAGVVTEAGVVSAEVEAGGSMTLEDVNRVRVRMERPNDVKKKRTAAPIVILLKNVAAPRLPKTVWPDPPNAAPMSAPLPDWRRTTATRRKQLRTWMMSKNVYI